MKIVYLVSLYNFKGQIQELVRLICLFGKKCHVRGKNCRIFPRAGCYDANRSETTNSDPDQGEKMFTKRLFNVLVVLILGIVAFFALRVAAETGTPGQYSSRYNQTGQTASTDSNFPTGKFIKSGATDYGFIFNEDGTYSRFERNVTATHGTYSVDSNVFTETSNDGGCASNTSHMFTFDGKNLTFNYVGNLEDDACGDGGRRADFNNVTYTLVE